MIKFSEKNKVFVIIFGTLVIVLAIFLAIFLKNDESNNKKTTNKNKNLHSTYEVEIVNKIDKTDIEGIDFEEIYKETSKNDQADKNENFKSEIVEESLQNDLKKKEDIDPDEKDITIVENLEKSKIVEFKNITTEIVERDKVMKIRGNIKNLGANNLEFLAINVYFINSKEEILNSEFALVLNNKTLTPNENYDFESCIPYDFGLLDWKNIKIEPIFS